MVKFCFIFSMYDWHIMILSQVPKMGVCHGSMWTFIVEFLALQNMFKFETQDLFNLHLQE